MAHNWHLEWLNENKTDIEPRDFAKDLEKLRLVYKAYLRAFPKTFITNRQKRNNRDLEKDYDQYVEHDLAQLAVILDTLEEAEQYGPDRPHKAPNLHIWSHLPGFGKTRLMSFLKANTLTYSLPEDQYYVDYENGIFKVLVSDEARAFLSTKKYSHLKLLLEGQGIEFNRKGREKVVKKDNPLILMASNNPFDAALRSVFGDRHEEEPMKDRVRCVELKSRATLHFMISCVFGWDDPKNQDMVDLPSKVIGLPLLKAMEGTQGGKEAIA